MIPVHKALSLLILCLLLDTIAMAERSGSSHFRRDLHEYLRPPPPPPPELRLRPRSPPRGPQFAGHNRSPPRIARWFFSKEKERAPSHPPMFKPRPPPSFHKRPEMSETQQFVQVHYGPPRKHFKPPEEECNPCNKVPWVPLSKTPAGVSDQVMSLVAAPNLAKYPGNSYGPPSSSGSGVSYDVYEGHSNGAGGEQLTAPSNVPSHEQDQSYDLQPPSPDAHADHSQQQQSADLGKVVINFSSDQNVGSDQQPLAQNTHAPQDDNNFDIVQSVEHQLQPQSQSSGAGNNDEVHLVPHDLKPPPIISQSGFHFGPSQSEDHIEQLNGHNQISQEQRGHEDKTPGLLPGTFFHTVHYPPKPHHSHYIPPDSGNGNIQQQPLNAQQDIGLVPPALPPNHRPDNSFLIDLQPPTEQLGNPPQNGQPYRGDQPPDPHIEQPNKDHQFNQNQPSYEDNFISDIQVNHDNKHNDGSSNFAQPPQGQVLFPEKRPPEVIFPDKPGTFSSNNEHFSQQYQPEPAESQIPIEPNINEDSEQESQRESEKQNSEHVTSQPIVDYSPWTPTSGPYSTIGNTKFHILNPSGTTASPIFVTPSKNLHPDSGFSFESNNILGPNFEGNFVGSPTNEVAQIPLPPVRPGVKKTKQIRIIVPYTSSNQFNLQPGSKPFYVNFQRDLVSSGSNSNNSGRVQRLPPPNNQRINKGNGNKNPQQNTVPASSANSVHHTVFSNGHGLPWNLQTQFHQPQPTSTSDPAKSEISIKPLPGVDYSIQHILASNIRNLLLDEEMDTSDGEDNPGDDDLIRLQKNIDKWTAQAYSKPLEDFKKSTPTLFLKQSKNIPEEFLPRPTMSMNVPSTTTPVESLKALFHEHRSRVAKSGPRKKSQQESSTDISVLSTTGFNQANWTEGYDDQFKAVTWDDTRLAISPSTNEKVYVVTPVSTIKVSTPNPKPVTSKSKKIPVAKRMSTTTNKPSTSVNDISPFRKGPVFIVTPQTTVTPPVTTPAFSFQSPRFLIRPTPLWYGQRFEAKDKENYFATVSPTGPDVPNDNWSPNKNDKASEEKYYDFGDMIASQSIQEDSSTDFPTTLPMTATTAPDSAIDQTSLPTTTTNGQREGKAGFPDLTTTITYSPPEGSTVETIGGHSKVITIVTSSSSSTRSVTSSHKKPLGLDAKKALDVPKNKTESTTEKTVTQIISAETKPMDHASGGKLAQTLKISSTTSKPTPSTNNNIFSSSRIQLKVTDISAGKNETNANKEDPSDTKTVFTKSILITKNTNKSGQTVNKGSSNKSTQKTVKDSSPKISRRQDTFILKHFPEILTPGQRLNNDDMDAVRGVVVEIKRKPQSITVT